MKFTSRQIDLGVLGGMGPLATHYFMGEILRAVVDRRRPQRDQDYPNIIVRYACHLPDRTAVLESDPAPFAKALKEEIALLAGLGCRRMVVPCITAHPFLAGLAAKFGVMDIPQIVSAHLAREFPGSRLGVLATRGARGAGVAGMFSSGAGPALVLPPDEEEALMAFVYRDAKTGRANGEGPKLFELAERLRRRGCDLVIAGCTEVEMCLAGKTRAVNGFVFPLRIVADTFVAEWARK